MAEAIIKCPYCGKMYFVVPQDLNKGQLVYDCECGKNFQVEFFDHCPRCQVNIGFITSSDSFKNDMKDVGLGILKTVTSPLSAVTHFGEWLLDAASGQVKECNGDGCCPICRLRYLRCPSCNEVFQVPKSANYKDKYDCPHCGTTVFPSYSIRPGCGGKHSKAFYKWSYEPR